jgi:hypothetical protein
MSDISSRLLLKTIDQIAGKANAQANAAAPDEDLYTILIKEQNPDDLVAGVAPALNTDAKVANGTGLYVQWSAHIKWLNNRAVAAGSTDLGTLLGARFARAPKSFDDRVWSPGRNGQHISSVSLFTDEVTELGTASRGASSTTYAAGGGMPSTVLHAYVEADCTKYGGSPWTVNLVANYADGSTGAVALSLSATAAQDVGAHIATGSYLATAGGNQIKLTSTTGIAAGHRLLLIDRTYPSLLATDYYTGGVEVWIDPKYIGYFDPADAVNFVKGDGTVSDTSSTINNIDYEHGKITLNAALSYNFLSADASFMCLNAPEGDGWQEAHYVSATPTGGVVTFSGPLYHSFYGRTSNGAKAVQLLRGVSFVSGSGGTSGDEVVIQTKSERTI